MRNVRFYRQSVTLELTSLLVINDCATKFIWCGRLYRTQFGNHKFIRLVFFKTYVINCDTCVSKTTSLKMRLHRACRYYLLACCLLRFFWRSRKSNQPKKFTLNAPPLALTVICQPAWPLKPVCATYMYMYTHTCTPIFRITYMYMYHS